MEWTILFYIMVLVPLIKPLPQSSIHTNLENQTSINLLNKMGMLNDKFLFEMNNLRNTLPLMLDQPSNPVTSNDRRSCPICKCGTHGKKDRIVGGVQVQYAHKYPWMASLSGVHKNGKWFCGATLINDRYVLTAAHCVRSVNLTTARVRLFENDYDDKNGFQYRIRRIIIHENYDIIPHDSDIALIRLDIDSGLPISTNLHPVCMPKEGLSYENELGVATGWGKVNEYKDEISMVLREVKMPILNNAKCETGWNWITENMMCAGVLEGGKDTCQGDSGGPLTVANNAVHHLVGITSFGRGCGVRNSPGVYVKVNNYLKWIKDNTLDACSCNSN